MLSRYELTIYANPGGEIDPSRVKDLLSDAVNLGGDTAPIEYVAPISGDPQPWGLRIVIEGDE
jgi:hypothetical protein